MVTSNFTCGAEKRPSSSEASAEANIELCTGQGRAWEVSENHSAHLERGCRLSPLYPQPQALLQSPQILVLAFLPLLQQLAPPSISPAWGFPPCLLDQNMTTGFLLCPSQARSGPLAFSRQSASFKSEQSHCTCTKYACLWPSDLALPQTLGVS